MTSEQRIIVETALAMILLEAGSYTYDTILVKRSLTGDSASGPCEECDANEAEGWIDSEAIYPSGDDGPPFHPNCFLGSTLVASAGSIAAQTKRWYEGEIVTLRIPGVDDLSCTPNHPILTRRGWVAAGRLEFSDDLIQCVSPRDLFAILHPNDDYIEARIQDIARTLLVSGGVTTRSVPLSSIAFHGDVQINAEVDIVRAARTFKGDSFIAVPSESTRRQFSHDKTFARSQPFRGAFPRDGASAQFVGAPNLTAHSFVGGGAVRASLSSSEPSIPNQLGVTARALLESKSVPVANDHRSRNANLYGQLQNAMPGQVRLVKLSEINSSDFAGHVYNLQTQDGWYSADTMIVHNCVCDEEYKEKRVRVYN